VSTSLTPQTVVFLTGNLVGLSVAVLSDTAGSPTSGDLHVKVVRAGSDTVHRSRGVPQALGGPDQRRLNDRVDQVKPRERVVDDALEKNHVADSSFPVS
jgi:hypothetical protein